MFFSKLGVYINFSSIVLSLKIPAVSLKMPVIAKKGSRKRRENGDNCKEEIKLEVYMERIKEEKRKRVNSFTDGWTKGQTNIVTQKVASLLKI